MLNLRHLQIKIQSFPHILNSIHLVMDDVAEFVNGSSVDAFARTENLAEDVNQAVRTIKHQVTSLLSYADFLNRRVESTAQLFAEGLMLKDQLLSQQLAALSRDQNEIMCAMTRLTLRDSTSVKVITVATLVYLPTMFVAVSERTLECLKVCALTKGADSLRQRSILSR